MSDSSEFKAPNSQLGTVAHAQFVCTSVEKNDQQFIEDLKALKSRKAKFPDSDEAALLEIANEGHSVLCIFGRALAESRGTSLITALKVGYALHELQSKRKGEGNWVEFMETNLSGISSATIYRYIRLAERFPDPTSIPANLGIMDAYRFAGLLVDRKDRSDCEGPAKRKECQSRGRPEQVVEAIERSITKLGVSIAKACFEASDRKATGQRVLCLAEKLKKLARQLTSGRGGGKTRGDDHAT